MHSPEREYITEARRNVKGEDLAASEVELH
jgi:hypothetical protein